MYILATYFVIFFLKTTKIIIMWKVWKSSCIWPSNFFLAIGYIFTFACTKSSSLFSEVIHVMKVISIAPVTNAILEKSFSTLKRTKTSIFSTMTDSRLSHLLVTLIYNNKLDEIDIRLITNEFIKVKKPRIATFALYQIICFAFFVA